MAHPSPTGGRGRERLVLAVGLVSTLALLWAAFAAYGEPRRAGEAELARIMGEFSDAVVAEWDRMRRDPWPFVEETELLRWSEEHLDPQDDSPPPRDWRAERADPYPAFDALLAEARRIERQEGDAAEALEVVLETLTKSCGPPRRAEARLRAIQLAVRIERPDVAIEQWELAWAELEGWEAQGDTSYLLLGTLATAPHLTAERRREARGRLVELWFEDRLALPDPIPRPEASTVQAGGADLLRHPLLPLRDSLRKLVHDLAEGPAPRLDRAEHSYRRRLVESVCGELENPAVPGTWGVRRLGAAALAYRRSPDEPTLMEGAVLSSGAVENRLILGVQRSRILDRGFGVEIGMTTIDDPIEVLENVDPHTYRSPVPYVSEPARLPDSDFEFTVSHGDPDSVVSGAAKRARLLRAGLLLLALFTGAAAFSTARVLRRERALAALKTSFVANVSHELRTPLSSILLMAENLERHLVTSEETRDKYHGLIRREAQRLRRLVDDVLDFSRLERGEDLALRIEEVDTGAFARDLETEVRERATAAELRLTFDVEELPTNARFDVEAVRRAVLNLVDNAVKHAGASHLDVALTKSGRGGLRIGVRDDGVGIPVGRRAEIFAPFARLDEGVQTSGAPGTGLGLAIVREIAIAHGGEASCLDPGTAGGACFEIVLPPAPRDAKMEEA